MAESDTWEGKENLENAKEVIEEYEREYRRDIEDVRRQEKEEEIFLPEREATKKVYSKKIIWVDRQKI